MESFQPRIFNIELTPTGFESTMRLMEITGLSYAQICKAGIERAVENSKENPCIMPESWKSREIDSSSLSGLRLPTDIQQGLDKLARQVDSSWEDMASFVTECEVFYYLEFLGTESVS